ncbi:MAG TPA: hypothetical protein VNC61_11840 [Acidimicrobiales bacterium]|nr:hypothetical protein [Acidimicrobiales bacterium]
MRALTRTVVLAVTGPLLLVGLSSAAGASAATASAKATHAKGSPAWCKNHPKSTLAACHKTTGGGGGSGGSSPTITVKVSPNTTADPLVETGMSEIHAVVEVKTSPSFADDTVNIASSQLAAVCGGAILFGSLQPNVNFSADSVQVALDADGNATVSLYAIDCAPGPSLIEADLTVAPFLTALTTLNALPPVVTPAGVSGSPANEVESGNSQKSGDSLVYAVFYVETDPVYAEQSVEIDSPQLLNRCIRGITWISNGGSFNGATATATLDNDGNAVFAFSGESCAAGPSAVIADVLAGVHSTYVTTYAIAAPVPTI